jgi:predicted site-specific integrase-resolvase
MVDLLMSIMSIGKFAKAVGLSEATLRKMHRTGELVPVRVSNGGTRYYSDEQVRLLTDGSFSKRVVGYICLCGDLSSALQGKYLDSFKLYMLDRGYGDFILKDVSFESGNLPAGDSLLSLVNMICNKLISKLVLSGVDYINMQTMSLLREICSACGVVLEICD